MIKALFTYDYGNEKMNLIKDLGYEIIIRHEKGIVYSDEFSDVEVLVCYNPFQSLDITKMKNLKWIQLSSIGIDQAPIEHIKNSKIILTNNKGGYSIPIGEWIVMNILQLIKNSYNFFKNQQNRIWKLDTSVMELYGKTIGFIGTGSIAVEAAKRLSGFGVKILGLNTGGRYVKGFDLCFKKDEIDKMLSKCDIVILTIPYTKETHHLIDEDRFKAMKDGVYFINVARGSIVDEKALIKYIQQGKIKGAALDVFENEPLALDSPLWSLENVIVTPHNSWVSEMRNERRFNIIYENMKRYANGLELLNIVDLGKGY